MTEKGRQGRNIKSDYEDDLLEKPIIYNMPSQTDSYTEKAPVRRISKNGKKSRALKKILIIFLFIIALLALCAVLSLTLLKVEKISVAGKSDYKNEEIISNSGINYGDKVLLLKKDQIQSRITSNLPYIKAVKIKYNFPSEIIINVTRDSDEYFCKLNKNKAVILDSDFKVMKEAKKNDKNLIKLKISGITEYSAGKRLKAKNNSALSYLKTVASYLDEMNYSKITSIGFNKQSEIFFSYDGRIKINIGVMSEDYKTRITRGMAACKKLDDEDPTVRGVINVNSDRQFYFTPEKG